MTQTNQPHAEAGSTGPIAPPEYAAERAAEVVRRMAAQRAILSYDRGLLTVEELFHQLAEVLIATGSTCAHLTDGDV